MIIAEGLHYYLTVSPITRHGHWKTTENIFNQHIISVSVTFLVCIGDYRYTWELLRIYICSTKCNKASHILSRLCTSQLQLHILSYTFSSSIIICKGILNIHTSVVMAGSKASMKTPMPFKFPAQWEIEALHDFIIIWELRVYYRCSANIDQGIHGIPPLNMCTQQHNAVLLTTE